MDWFKHVKRVCCSATFRTTLIAFLCLFCSFFWFSSRRPACLTFLAVCRGSEGIQQESTTTSILGWYPNYNLWHLAFSVPSPSTFAMPAFPARLAPFICGLFLNMAFYNLLLRCRGHIWNVWRHHVCKSVFPHLLLWICGLISKIWFSFRYSGHRTQIYDPLRDSIDLPIHLQPVDPMSRKQRCLLNKATPPGNKRLALFMMALARLGNQEMFTLAEDRRIHRQLRKYRSYNGNLQTNKLDGLPTEHLVQIQNRIKATSDEAATIAQSTIGVDTPDMLPAIADTGCSFTALNSFKFIDPKSIKRLARPIRMGGIAGGLEMQYVGVADFEVLLPTGDVHTFQEQCLINEDLPDSLFSPQAFLSHQANKGKGILDPDKFLQLYEDESDDNSSQQSNDEHFRIFHNRAEWHKDNKLLLTLNYDRCFLPRLTLHRKGTSLSTAKALNSALESKISNPML